MWMAAIVASGHQVGRRTLSPAPDDPTELADWYVESFERVLAVLGSANPDAVTWTFSTTGDRTVHWWCRRLAVEVAIHRWDAQLAKAARRGSGPEPVDGEVAATGVEEFVAEFLPGLLGAESVEGLGGTLHLQATDGPPEWWIDLDRGGSAVPGHAKADTAIRASRSDLLLWLTNRGPLDSLMVAGDKTVADSWRQLRR
jgi:MDMPI C-terminal domain/Mycothiol maleylpyruvate isomerase N-terminal domain